MKRNLLGGKLLTATSLAVFLAGSLGGPCSASAQPRTEAQHTHTHDSSEKLGQVNFTVACAPEAQQQFNRAVAWLHSFEYEEAEKAFTEVTVSDAATPTAPDLSSRKRKRSLLSNSVPLSLRSQCSTNLTLKR